METPTGELVWLPERERESARALRLSLAEKDCAPALACVWRDSREDGYGYGDGCGCGCGCGSIICRDTTGAGRVHTWLGLHDRVSLVRNLPPYLYQKKTRHQTKSTLYILQTYTIRTASSSALRRYLLSRTAARRYLAVAEIEEASRTTLNRLLLPILLEYLQDLLNTTYIFRRHYDDLRA